MPFRPKSLIGRLANRRAHQYWQEASAQAADADLETLKDLRGKAQKLKRNINGFLHQADGRLALPRLGSNALNRPAGSDWVWRPELWRGPVQPHGVAGAKHRTHLGTEAEIYHDCPRSEITIRQRRNAGPGDLAPFGVELDVLGFAGSYLSFVVNLPNEAATGLSKRHIFRIDAVTQRERPMTVYARLNIQHGPNKEEIASQLEGPDHACVAEFDLGFSDINEKRIEKLWCEFFFEAPAMKRIVFRDMTLSRRLRSEV